MNAHPGMPSEADPLDDAAAPASPMSAAERLALSRARMKTYLAERSPKRRQRARVGDAASLPGIDLLMAKLKEHPIAAAVYDAVTNWWKSHPVHAFGVIAGAAARDAAGPLVRRHPVAMVCVALVAGALVARMRPWRLVMKSALFAGLASQVLSRLVSAVPIDAVLGALMRFTSRRDDEPAPADAAGAAPPLRPAAPPSPAPTASAPPAPRASAPAPSPPQPATSPP